jgi:hypothetical protein
VGKEKKPAGMTPSVRKKIVKVLTDLLNSEKVREHPAFVKAEATGDGIDVTVQPQNVDHPVTITLQVTSAALIPLRKRRRRPE